MKILINPSAGTPEAEEPQADQPTNFFFLNSGLFCQIELIFNENNFFLKNRHFHFFFTFKIFSHGKY